jgi:hypothetical protein
LIGAVGGSPPRVPVWSDEICAHKALVEVIGPSVPPLVQDLPVRANPNPGNAPVPRFVAATPPKSSLPAEFVVGGKGAGNVFDGNQISLTVAKKIARVCRDWAASKDGTMSLYVIDNAGEFEHMERAHGRPSLQQHPYRAVEGADLAQDAPAHIDCGRAAQEQSERHCAANHIF